MVCHGLPLNGLDHLPTFSTGLEANGRCRDLYFGRLGKHGRFFGTSVTYNRPKSSSPARKPGLQPYHSSKVSQSKRTPFAMARPVSTKASLPLQVYVTGDATSIC